MINETTPPKYLYKVLSVEDWERSQSLNSIHLSLDDKDFIHFSTYEQLDRILEKYWGNSQGFVVLTIDVKKLPGNLAYEANAGGINKYYHLYDGSIPLNAVVESKQDLR